MGMLDSTILNLNKSRQRAIYYRPDGTPTRPLPSDPSGQLYYLAKGFTLKKPGQAAVRESSGKCPFCDFEPKNALSLRTHLTKHVKEDTNETEEETNELS